MTEKEQALYDLFGFETKFVNYLINISNNYKYIYFETPKVGCSTIKRTLQQLEVDNVSEIPEDVHNKQASPLLSPLQLEKKFTEYLTDEYFKFSFVRNPYTRILSCYLDKIVGSSKRVFLPHIGFDPSAELSFKEFLLVVKKQSYAEMNSHWRPQSVLLSADNITLDFIGRQENFDNDLQKVLDIINKTESNLNKIENEAPHAVGANKKLREYITEDVANLIQEIYADDFSLYGYNKDPFSTDMLAPVDLNIFRKPKLVSIVIPCYNQAQYLKECVASAVSQTYPNIEIVIVNDGSTDNTQETAEELKSKYPSKIRIVSQPNQGLSQARNNGIKAALGEYILPLDSDDYIDRTMISKTMRRMSISNVDLAGTDGQCFGVQTYKIRTKDFPECILPYANCWLVSTLFKREVWEETGGYKENMNGGYEDWEFWINAYRHGFKFKRYPDVLFHYRTKEESMYTEAFKKDSYLKAKITVNNPELYTKSYVENAISIIKEIEQMADLYFYYHIPNNNLEKYFSEVTDYISKNTLDEKQIITINNKKIGLCSLEVYENIESVQKLMKEINVEGILFYAPLLYNLIDLQTIEYAWSKDKGIISATGNNFPFFPKSVRENAQSQLIAYQRLLEYKEKEIEQDKLMLEKKLKLLTDKELIIQQKTEETNKLKQEVKNQNDKLQQKIQSQNDMFQQKIQNQNDKLQLLSNSIQKITQFSIKTNPIQKYRAYKSILQTYDHIKKMKNEK